MISVAARRLLHASALPLAVVTLFVLATGSLHATSPIASARQGKDSKDAKRPGLSLRASPNVSLAPARIVLVAELKGGPNDYEEYYCAGVEWDWDDGTTSESSNDCEPYEIGKSEIKRRFTVVHVYQGSGNYRIQFKLKKERKLLAVATTRVQVRPGLREPS